MTSTIERSRGGAATAGGPLQPRPPRSPLRRKIVGAAIAVVVLASAVAVPLSLGLVPSVYQPPLGEDVALVVDDREVTVADFDKRVRTLKALYGAQEPGDPAGQDRFRRDVARSVAASTVMDDAIEERSIVIPEPRLRQQLTGMVEAQFGQGPAAYQQFMEGLRQAGSSEPEMLAEIRQQIAMTELVTQVTNDVVAPRDDELPAEFGKYAEQFGIPEQRRLANIVVPSREQAQDIINQIRGGIPFADVARRVSIDPATKDRGGDFGGPIAKSNLQPAYGNAAFSLPQGQVYGPVQSAEGWNVGQTLQIIPGQPANFEESVIPLKAAVLNERKFTFWKQWFEQRMADAGIRYNDAYRPVEGSGAPAALDAADPGGRTAPAGQPAPGQQPR